MFGSDVVMAPPTIGFPAINFCFAVLYMRTGEACRFCACASELITRVHDETLKAGKKLGGPLGWQGRHGFSFFQAFNVANVDKIAAVPGVDVIFAASGDIGSFTGWQRSDPWERRYPEPRCPWLSGYRLLSRPALE